MNFKTSFFLLFFISFLNYGQTIISGTVTFKNKGIKEISVTLKDTYNGATTDEKGHFSFETSEKGNQILVFSGMKFDEVSKPINLDQSTENIDMELTEKIDEIDAVVISAGSIEASDKKRATTLLTPIDIYTTAGANGQISSALNYLPGVQKIGENEGLFVRGGTGAETKIFMDGSLINNYFSNSVPGLAGRDRFNTSLFKGNIFSSGGYSALYGQALSGVLILESVDLPEKSSYDFGGSPIFFNAGFQKLTTEKNSSFGINTGYSNLGLMQKTFNFNTDFIKAPESFNGDANFRIKTKSGGIFKYYGSVGFNKLAVQSKSLELDEGDNKINLKSFNNFHNLSFRQKMGKNTLNIGSSFTYNQTDLQFSTINNDTETSQNSVNTREKDFNFKAVFERKLRKISTFRTGLEVNTVNERNNFGKNYNDVISAGFLETDLGFSNNLSAKIGVRAENSSYLDQWNMAPRFALAYRLSKEWTSSLAYGIFYQNPENKYINNNASLNFQKAEHYILQLQRSSEGRSFRLEGFYKNYDQLIKTDNTQYIQTAINNAGNGFAKGVEVFWRDKKSIKNIDYWLSYSYLDTKRDFNNYPVSLVPNFAAKHTLSLVAKKFVENWKTGFNISYTYASGRPYYDITSQNQQTVLRHQGTLKSYNGLNLSLNYLPNLGKKEAKAFTIFVLSVTNVLGSKNVYGYNFSNDGIRSSAVVPPVNTFVFLGVFINLGVDKTQDAINNNL